VGTTSSVGGIFESGNQVNGPIYGSSDSLELDYFALNHRGYLYSCLEGVYRIDVTYSNDAVDLWIGAKAYAGWTESNADAKARYNQPDHIAGQASFSFSVPADSYIPIRFVFGQAQYGGGFRFTITAPNGQVIVSDEPTDSPYVVRYSCDGVSAPVYPPFGREP
jgi:hypothetical protein